MIRIDQTDAKKGEAAKRADRKGGSKMEQIAQKSAFLATFVQTRKEMVQGELKDLLTRIDRSAEDLEKSMTFRGIDEYRGLVKEFLRIAVGEAYAVDQKLSISQTGRTKVMITVQKVNEEVDAMVRDFSEKNSGLFDFMGRVGKIRGLLVDLLS